MRFKKKKKINKKGGEEGKGGYVEDKNEEENQVFNMSCVFNMTVYTHSCGGGVCRR